MKYAQGNFIQVSDVPKPIELNLFVNAMNRMSRILQNLFGELTLSKPKNINELLMLMS